ncbi:hypothetical protein ACFHYQ_15305 [Sphaerimonospora cavernae]|uniref:Uncharacterized protein n=1 Tax=Sphaerimonospora cavernae TaxID=1740611 RepID=A0ABV6U6L2_9ACTN
MTYERDFFRDAAVHDISPVLSSAVQVIDAAFPDELCLRLRPVLPHLAGTADDGRDGDRVRLAQDWLVRTCLAAWMRAAGQQDEAVRLRRLTPVRDIGTALRAAGVAAQASGKVMISAPGRAEGFPLVSTAVGAANRAVKTMTVWNCVAAAGAAFAGSTGRHPPMGSGHGDGVKPDRSGGASGRFAGRGGSVSVSRSPSQVPTTW